MQHNVRRLFSFYAPVKLNPDVYQSLILHIWRVQTGYFKVHVIHSLCWNRTFTTDISIRRTKTGWTHLSFHVSVHVSSVHSLRSRQCYGNVGDLLHCDSNLFYGIRYFVPTHVSVYRVHDASTVTLSYLEIKTRDGLRPATNWYVVVSINMLRGPLGELWRIWYYLKSTFLVTVVDSHCPFECRLCPELIRDIL